MTHVCCPRCRLRFTPAVSAYLASCPECGEPLQTLVGAESVVGFRRFKPEDPAYPLPEALAESMPRPEPPGSRT
jgi:hypothetical protein